MKAATAFIFFMLFLAGIAFVNLRNMQGGDDTTVSSGDQLVDVAWRPTNIGEMRLDDATEMFLQFNADGQVGGHGGCNRFFGEYDFQDDHLSFGEMGMTRMACPQPADSFEHAFMEALGNTATAARVDNRMAFRDEKERSILRFVAIPRINE